MNACYKTFIPSVLLLLPHDVKSTGSYLASIIYEFELANEDIIDMLLDNLIPPDNDSSHIKNIMEALIIYYKELTSNLVDSLGDTFTNPTIDTSIDVSDYLISMEKRYLRFKLGKLYLLFSTFFSPFLSERLILTINVI